VKAPSAVEIIADTTSGDVKQIRTGETAKPTFPFTHKAMPEAKGRARSNWPSGSRPGKSVLPRSYVNRVWPT